MRSTFSGLNTMVRGIYANQLSLDTVGHNIANASTDGYSRQRVNLATSSPDTIYSVNGSYQLGTGVNIESVTRARDTFMDRQYWKEASTLGYALSSEDALGKIEGIFHDELPDIGIQSILNDFWSSWQTLATTASNDSARTAVRERGAELVDAIQHAATQLKSLVSDINEALDAKTAEINQMAQELFSLNRQVANVEIGGRDNANDLRDRRDLLVDKLSKMMNVTVYEDSNHNYVVSANGMILADGDGYTALALNSPSTSKDPDYGYEVRHVVVAGTNQRVNFTNGEMKALQEANTTMVKGYLDQLSTMSQYLLQEFNATHRAGYGTDNSTNNNFFGDPARNYATDPMTTKGGWIDALSVNRDLFNTGGLAKIAAKTLVQNPVTQSNASGGLGSVGGSYTSAAYTSYQIRITHVLGTGQVDAASYTTDGGTTWIAVDAADIDTSHAGYTVINDLPNGLNFTVAADVENRGASGSYAGDTYSFSVPQGNASGDNATLLSARLKSPTDASSVLAGSSLDDYYKSMIGELGVAAQSRQRLADNQQTLINQIVNWREATAGVNIDEEMSNMIRFQKGYNAAARVMTTIDEMLDKLINSTGVVGR